MTNPFAAEYERYRGLARRHSDEYQQAEPFPHVCLDDFFSIDLCDEVLAEFSNATGESWLKFNDPTGVKFASKGVSSLGPVAHLVLGYFNSGPFIEFLELLTGIEGLIPDPWYEGGGLHQINRGGYLKVHADFNWHKRLRLDRRVNVLLYLNHDWQEEYGGHLEIWNRDMSHCEQRFLPIFNRCVIFNTTDLAYHGHPHPLTCPESRSRKSLALYFYSNGRPEEERSKSHTTLYQMTPEERRRTRSLSYRVRSLTSNCLECMASLANKPSALLRLLADKARPRH